VSKRDRLSDAETVLIARAVGNHIQYRGAARSDQWAANSANANSKINAAQKQGPNTSINPPAKIFAIATAGSFSKSRRAGSRPAKRSSSWSKYQSDMIIRRLAASTYKTRGALDFEMTLWSPSLRVHKTSELPTKYLLVGTVVVITTTALLRHCLGLYGGPKWPLARARRRTNPRSVSQRDRRALGSTFSNYTWPSSSVSRPDLFSGMLTSQAYLYILRRGRWSVTAPSDPSPARPERELVGHFSHADEILLEPATLFL
jgi:hypothetical protein